MTIKVSSALRNGILAGSSVSELLTNGYIRIFSGPVPATADDAVDGSCVLLAKVAADEPAIDDGIVGLQFEGAAVSGALSKLSTQTWAGKVVASGEATFARFGTAADACTAAGDTTTPRIQGTTAVTGGDFTMTNVNLVDNEVNTTGFATFEIRQPAG